MPVVVISKLPEFTPDGEVVPGQCEPYTGGWKLRLVEDGREEEILSGTYYEIRRVQRRCMGKTSDEMREIAAESAEAIKAGSGPPLPGETDESTQILGIDDVRRAMLQMELSAGVGGALPQADWVELTVHDGVSVASVRRGGGPEDADEFGRVMGAALGAAEGGLVVDLGGEEIETEGLARVLRELGERAKAENRFFGVVRAPEDLAKAVGEGEAGEVVGLYADVESALGSARPGGD